MKRTTVSIIIVLIAILVGSIWQVTRKERGKSHTTRPLVVHCAAGMRVPVSEIARRYEEEFGVPVHLQFNGSGALEAQLALAGGDLFLAADDSFIRSARAKGLVLEALPVAALTAGIVVAKGNPKNLRTLEDFARPGIRISMADRSAAVGKLTWSVIEKCGRFSEIQANVVVTKPTVNNIVEDVASGAVDATFAWEAVAKSFSGLEWIPVPEFSVRPSCSSIGVLTSSSEPMRALHFARYLTAKDRGLGVFEKNGFTPTVPADVWADTPEVTLFAGSMLRPAIQERIREFEKREGCHITTIFEGCGTLVAMMKDGGAKPAAYFSCDTKFLDMVADRFNPSTIVSSNQIILLVSKGNPLKIRQLEDLVKPGLRIGICDPQKSALGYLTRVMLASENLADRVDRSGNISLMSAKGDDLVNAMQARSLDVAIVYRSNALASQPILESCEMVTIDKPMATATQPFAVARDTPYPQLAARLGNYLSNNEARQIFEKLGFAWKLEPGKD